MHRWRSFVVPAWTTFLALLMLGPALGPGYVLSYDMVWVPDLALRDDFLGLGSGLPRAVPSDAVVAVLDELVPGMLLQKLVLLGALIGAGLGAAWLAPPGSLPGALVAATFYVWNPFVVERLVIGHWPVLMAYAVLPWVVGAGREWRRTGRVPARLWLLVVTGSLSASAGLMTGVVLVAFAVAAQTRRMLLLAVLLLGANAPWLVAGVLHAGSATTDPRGAARFALFGEGSLPAPLAALGLGGIWNSEVVPDSRTGIAAWLALGLMLLLVAAGWRSWVRSLQVNGPSDGRARRAPARDLVAFAVCWVVGWGLAVLTWAAPDLMAWLVAHVPGAGLLRDGSRLLGLCALALTPPVAAGAVAVLRALPSGARPASVLALVLAPIALMPDAAYGVSGRLGAVAFPDDFATAHRAIERAIDRSEVEGDLLVLPLTSYRQPSWNGDRKVLDPVGRYLPVDYVASDELVVSGERIAGEDDRARAAVEALDQDTPEARGLALARLGIGLVAITPASGIPEVAGDPLHEGKTLAVLGFSAVEASSTPRSWRVAMVWAWSLFIGVSLAGGKGMIRTRRNRNTRFS